MATAQQPPDLNIPHSDATVEVSIIDTTSHLSLPSLMLVEPELPNFNTITACCYSFLIKHRSSSSSDTNPQPQTNTNVKYNTLLFDLGIRKDWQNGPASIVEQVTPFKSNLHIEKDVATILRENDQSLEDIGGIVWSHWHFDHTGDPATFPPWTDLIVGPGFKSAFVPGFPTVPESPVDERAWQDRELREIDFESESDGLRIGKFRAFDFYGDGSFYLLDTPGHAIGHLCALARTTANPPTFMFLGGDIAHHAGEFRPTEYLPLPDSITPSPLQAPFAAQATFCPGEVFEAIHPSKSRTKPFFSPSTGEHAVHADVAETRRSIEKLTEFDAYDNVFSVIAHDQSLFDVVEFYPKAANQWKEKGWAREGQWRFLGEFRAGIDEEKA
jgi:glyoxylase-like metal-dependent hydrolase (beta-lactamase superfamily II)